MRYIILFQIKGLKSSQPSNFKLVYFHSKTDFTFLLQLITFEALELKQSYMSHLKVLVCGMNTSSSHWLGCIFILCYTHLKIVLLLYKTVLVNYLMSTNVSTQITHQICYKGYKHSKYSNTVPKMGSVILLFFRPFVG